ncbi:VanZ family protein [Lederbergia sp. NSJ-179]|uniref:VanZ family protein n=1 Tax=Lederbergia sp. NSJ-179 TaxID=2931402 RepID=UPI001FD53525|nr:VanZ family protein [Lederbergia sp. NSJ-179]MCJ7842244.1 VanZ family protein [Lederbergia sp. NSJ-179]
MKKRHIWLAAAMLVCVAIFITTASPASTGGQTKLFILKILPISEEVAASLNVLFRKLVHLTAFGFLAILFYNSFEKNRFLIAWGLTTFYAATDEFHQVFIPERTGSWLDVGLDSLGALLALLALEFFRKCVVRRKKG